MKIVFEHVVGANDSDDGWQYVMSAKEVFETDNPELICLSMREGHSLTRPGESDTNELYTIYRVIWRPWGIGRRKQDRLDISQHWLFEPHVHVLLRKGFMSGEDITDNMDERVLRALASGVIAE